MGVGVLGRISRYTDYSHVVYQRKVHGKSNTLQGQFTTSKSMGPWWGWELLGRGDCVESYYSYYIVSELIPHVIGLGTEVCTLSYP